MTKEIKPNEPKRLTDAQMRALDNSKNEFIIKQLEAEILKLKQENLNLKAKNYGLIAQLKTVEIQEASNRAKSVKERHTEFVNNLKKEVGINTPEWGYDPETGEIR